MASLLCITALQGMKITINIFQAESYITMVDSVFHTQSLGPAPEGVGDQYADGKAARVWEVFIGDKNSRTQHYRQFLAGLLRSKGCRTVLDVACGTGWDGGSNFVHLLVWMKGKAVPLQAWSGPEGSRKLRFPDFMTTAEGGGKVLILTHRLPLPPGNTPGTHFC